MVCIFLIIKDIIPYVLFFIATALVILGFFIQHVSRFPRLLRILASSYCNAKQGFNELDSKDVLKPQNIGFKEISNLFVKDAPQNFVNDNGKICILRFERKLAIRFDSPKDGRQDYKAVDVVLSNKGIIHSHMQYIIDIIEKNRSAILFKCARAIFFLGIISQILLFLIA